MRSRHSIRALASAAAAAMAGGTLAIAAPAAHAAPPAAADVAGIATVNGVPAADIYVEIYDAEADGSPDYLGYTYTDANGEYWFDLDTSGSGGANDGYLNHTSDTPQVKLSYYDERALTGDVLRGGFEWYNDAPTFNRATPITKATPGSLATVPTVSLTPQAGIKGTVTVPVPAGYEYEGYVAAYDSDDEQVGGASFDNDPISTGRGNELTYLLDNLDPNQSYKLRFYAYAGPTSGTGPEFSYVSRFYKTGSTFADATPVAVGGSGSITQPIDMSLTNVLTADEAPSIVGQVAPGRTLKVDPGTWTVKAGTQYAYQWLLNEVQVSTAPTYKVAKGDLGKKLRVIVTARNDDFVGSASTVAEKVGYASKLNVRAVKAVLKGKTVVQVVGKVQVKGVKKSKLAKALKGKITVYEGDVRVGKGTVLKGGKILVTLRGITAGKHELTVEFDGKKAADAVSTEKVKV